MDTHAISTTTGNMKILMFFSVNVLQQQKSVVSQYIESHPSNTCKRKKKTAKRNNNNIVFEVQAHPPSLSIDITNIK